MRPLKEQREKLLQAKLEEMTDVDVKECTEENTPNFDGPTDSDDDSGSMEEDASVSLSKIDEQGGIPEETAFNGTDAKTARLPKRKRNSRTKDSSPATDFPRYEQRFLTSVHSGRNKLGFSIHTEMSQIPRDVLNDIRSGASIAGYVEDILLDHLKTHQNLLNHITSQRRRDKTIDL